MIHIAFVCCGLLASVPSSPAADVATAYRAAAARAGRDPQAHLKLALWCEAHALKAERAKHLAVAILIDPENLPARGLLGMVAHQGRWESPERVAERIKADEVLSRKLAEYNRRRARMLKQTARRASQSEMARAHAALADWCAVAGLKAEATAHFTSAVTLDPRRASAWKSLGYVRHNGRWMTREQIAAQLQDAEAQRRADERWGPLLARWRGWLTDNTKRTEAESLLAGVTDPRAVPEIVRVFRNGIGADLDVGLRLLAQIDGPASSRQLAALAVLPWSSATRSAAIEALRSREPRDYAALLVEMIQEPIRYEFQPVLGPGEPGALAIQAGGRRVLAYYDAPPVLQFAPSFFGYVGVGPNGLPIAVRGRELGAITGSSNQAAEALSWIEGRTADLIALAQDKAMDSQQQLTLDIASVERRNARTLQWNERIGKVLAATLSAPALPSDRNAWRTWWFDKLGYRYEAPPEREPETFAYFATVQQAPPSIYSCFAPGTPVRTVDGHRPIEDLQVGDRVLSLDTSTGALAFEPIQVVHHNKPGGTLQVELDRGETLVASVYHRFWRAGKGWAMARELQAGDVLRALGGPSRVVSVTPGPTAPLFNLDVAGGRTFFVGRQDALVHDNSLPDPGVKPFDAAPALLAGSR